MARSSLLNARCEKKKLCNPSQGMSGLRSWHIMTSRQVDITAESMALWDISGHSSGLHGTGPCQTDQRPPETLQPEPGKCSHPGSFPTHVLISGRLEGNGHDGHDGPWWSWTTLHARASVREMDLFDKSTWSQNRPIERCVLLCCMAYCCCLHFSLVLVQGLCNKPSRLQLSVCREQNSSLSDISA